MLLTNSESTNTFCTVGLPLVQPYHKPQHVELCIYCFFFPPELAAEKPMPKL